MAVLLYQLGIVLAIQIAAAFGKSSRNVAVVLISIFTLLQVFMSWLLLLQFVTIFLSYLLSENLFFNNQNKAVEKKNNDLVTLKEYGKNGERIYRQYNVNDPSLSAEIKEKIRKKKELDSHLNEMYQNNPEYKKRLDGIIKDMQNKFKG